MKGKLFKKALAASLALLIVSGSVPIKPVSNVVDSMVVTAEAAEEYSKTYDFSTGIRSNDRTSISLTDPVDNVSKTVITLTDSINSFIIWQTNPNFAPGFISNSTGVEGTDNSVGVDTTFIISPNVDGKVTKIEFSNVARNLSYSEEGATFVSDFSLKIDGMKYNGTDDVLTGIDGENDKRSFTFISTDEGGISGNLSLILGPNSLFKFQKGSKMIITYVPDEEPVHEHNFSFNASGNTLTATCANDDGLDCSLADSDHKATVTLTANGGQYFPEVVYGAGINLSAFNAQTGLNATASTITYTNKETGATTTNYVRDFGDYTASVTITINGTDYNLTKDFSVYAITCNYPQFSFNCDDGIITATFTPKNGESLKTMTLTGNNTNLSIGNGITDNGNGTYTFANPKESVTLSATLNYPENPNFTQNGNTYTINNADGWDYFCQRLEADGNGFSGKTIELADDISVTTMAGDGIHSFKGTFDGKGHTLDFRPTTATTYCAPFQNTNNATIRNLHATGQIEGGNWNYIGGLVGSANGDLTIENCRVSTQISSTISGNAWYGGFVGLLSSQYKQCYITGCVFDGLIYNSNTRNQTYGCGGFVGCFSEYGYAILKDCLFLEGQYDNNNGKCELWWGNDNNKNSTFLHRINDQGEGKLTNCFYVSTRGLKQGSPAVESTTRPANLGTEINYCFMKSYGHVLFFNGKYYTPTSGDLIEQYSYRGIKSYTIECNDGTSLGIPNITSPLWTSDLRYNRAFTAGKPEIVMLPFNFTKNDLRRGYEGDVLTGHFYEFKGVEYKDGAWKPVMGSANEVTTMNANTPYIFVPTMSTVPHPYEDNLEYVYVENYDTGINIFTAGNEGGNKTVTDKYGLWTLKGTYEPIIFTAYNTDDMILDNDGSLVEVTDDAKVNPTSGYFVRDNSAYSVTVNSANGGTVTADKNLAKENDTITLTVTPDAGYAVESVKYNDTNATKNADGTYSFTMPSENVTVSAEFVQVFTGESISLGGDIGVIFYLNPAVVKVGDTVSFSYTVNTNGTDNTTTKTYTLQSTDLKTVTYKGTDYRYYAAPCYVNAAEMTSLVTATVTVNGTEYTSATSVKTYANTILNDNEYSSAHDLVKAMLDYGAKAQTKFGRNTDNLANEGLKNADGTDYVTDSNITSANIISQRSDMENGLSNYGISYEGTSLLYLDKTTIRHYYTITDQTKFNSVNNAITFDGIECTYGTKDNYIYFEKPNIGADDLATAYALKIGENNYSFSALDYSKGVLEIYEANKGFTENDADLARATYAYATAAAAYNKQNGGA